MSDLEGAVERVKAVAGLPHTTPVRASVLVCQEDLRTILDALASITRERDAMREGLKPFGDIGDLLNAETSGFEDGDKLAVCIASAGGEEISPHVEMARLSFGSFIRAAALVNGEASDAS